MRHFLQICLTGASSVAISVVIWVVSVSIAVGSIRMLRLPFPVDETIITGLWAATLWFSFGMGAWLVSCSQRAASPVMACTTGCAIFATIYSVTEGPLYSPGVTAWAYGNLILVTFAVFVISDLARRSRRLKMRQQRLQAE